MPEVTVKYKNTKALNALKNLAKLFDLEIEKPAHKNLSKNEPSVNLPITFAKKPDITALAGIWEGRDITIDDLRKDAWGDRL
jgi:hypothetical protein